jgi:hypothetical protein
MILSYCPHSKNVHNLKVVLESFQIQSMFLKFQDFKSLLSHVNEA